MKIGVLSDIHSNMVALRECVTFMERQGCEEYILLGDYISDTPYTRGTLDYLYEFISSHKCTLIRGNREDYMLDQHKLIAGGGSSGIWIKNSASGNLLYAYEQLDERDFEFIEALPIAAVYKKEGYPAITIAHGSPDNSRQLLQHDSDALKQWLEKIDTDYLLCGHTHFQGITEYNGKKYFNPGSLGVAIGTPALAQCMILNGSSEGWEPDFRLIPFDNRRVARDCFKMGLWSYAPWFVNSNIQILLSGFDNAARLVECAIKMKQEELKDGEQVNWPYIEEEYFAKAAEKTGVPAYTSDEI